MYVTLDDLRGMKELANSASYSEATLTRACEYAQNLINGFTGTAFEPTAYAVTVNGSGTRRLFVRVPDLLSITSCEIDGESVDVAGLRVLSAGRMLRTSGTFTRGLENVRVTGMYGHETCPADVQAAARWIAWDYALSTTRRLPAAASLITRDEGQVAFQPHEPEAGRAGRATRNAEVNEVLRRRSVSPFMSGGWYA